MLISFEAIHLYIFLAVLLIALIGLWARGRSLSYLFFCAVFGIYLIGVISVVVFPIHIAERSMEFNGELQLNLVPFNFGRCDFLLICLRNIYENVLLTIPFGFGISFIAKIPRRNIPWVILLVGITLEFIQLVISLVVRSSFRVIDINDVILNAIGVLLGYGTFRMFGMLYIFIVNRFTMRPKYIFAYVYNVCISN